MPCSAYTTEWHTVVWADENNGEQCHMVVWADENNGEQCHMVVWADENNGEQCHTFSYVFLELCYFSSGLMK